MTRLAAGQLVGREAVTSACAQLLGRAVDAGGCVVIAGEAGIGKSALARQLTGSAAAGGWTVLPARFREGLGIPGDALSQICAAALGAGADPHHPHLGGLGGTVAPLIGGPSAVAGQPTGAPAPVLAEAVARLVEVCTTGKGRLVLLEDVQWADGDQLAVVEYWVDRFRSAGSALVLVVRSGELETVDDAIEEWERSRRAHVERLGALSAVHLAELVQACLGATPPEHLVEDAAAFSAGNPFLVEELLGELANGGELVEGEDGWRYHRSTRTPVPGSLRALVARRLDRLDDNAIQVARVAAVAGRQIDLEVVAVALGLPVPLVLEALDALWGAQLVERDAEGIWQFRHALSGAAVVDSSPPGALQMLATEALGALDGAFGADLDAPRLVSLARFAEAAGQPHRAAALLLQLGARVVGDGVLTGAVEMLLRAERLAAGNHELIVAARRLRVRALALSGEVGEALALGARLLEDRRAGGVPMADVELRSAMARVALTDGRFDDAVVLLDPLLVDRPDDGPGRAAVAGVTALAAAAHGGLGHRDAARALATEVLALPAADAAAHCEARLVLGRLARTTDLDEAESWFRHAAGDATAAGLVLWAAMAHHELATLAQIRRLDVESLDTAFRFALEAGALALASSVEFHIAALRGLRFEPGPALSWAQANERRWHHLGSPLQQAMAQVLVGQAYAVAGRRLDARRVGEAALARAPEQAEVAGLVHGLCFGLASLLDDDWAAASAELHHALDRLATVPVTGPLPPRWLGPLVDAVTGTGPVRAIGPEARNSLALFAGARSYFELRDAVELGRSGDLDGAEGAAARALDAMGELGSPFDGYRHLGLWLVAEAAHAAGWGESGRWLGAAEGWFAARGLERAAAGCRRTMTRVGIPARRRTRATAGVPPALARYGITTRELDVARLVVEGVVNAEIAATLHVSVRTVKTHVEHLLARTGTANRTQLAALLGPLLRGAARIGRPTDDPTGPGGER